MFFFPTVFPKAWPRVYTRAARVDFVYFVVLVSSLIFVHELGHFVVAKLFGVKVLTFSIGFGPKLLRLRGRETEYCVGLFPFGGFVRMLESSKSDMPVLPEEATRTFEAQALPKRVAIVLAGPAMNLLFPLLLYTTVYMEDRTLPPAVIGSVEAGMPADGQLLPDDVLVSVGGEEVRSFTDAQAIIAKGGGRALRFDVLREGRPLEIVVTPVSEWHALGPRALDLGEQIGKIGVSPRFLAPVIGIKKTDSPAYRAGLRTFDRITAVNGRRIERMTELVQVLSQNRGDAMVVSYSRPVAAEALGQVAEVALPDSGVVTLTPLPLEGDNKPADYVARSKDVEARTGIETSELYVAQVPAGSSEWQAGLRPGDRLESVDGDAVRSLRDAETKLVRNKPGEVVGALSPHELAWTRDGELVRGVLSIARLKVTPYAPRADQVRVENTKLVRYAVARGWNQTAFAVKFVAVGVVRVLQGKISLAYVTGPLGLVDVAGEAGRLGPTSFLWVMGLISVNLGLVNLLPIPVLDGGMLLLLLLESIRRKPFSLRVREVLSLAGVGLMMALMLVAFGNDLRHRIGGEPRPMLDP